MQRYLKNPLIFYENFSFPEIIKISMKVFLNTQRNSQIAVQMQHCKAMKIIPVKIWFHI